MTIRSVIITIIALLLALAAGGITCYKAGYKARVNEEKQEKLNEAQQEQSRLKAQQQLADNVLRGLADWSQNTKIVEIRHEKTNTVFRNECLTPEYQRLYNERVTEAESRLSGRAGSEVSDRKPATAKRSDGN
ncbi:Rz-like spanin [Klebsiella phage Kpn BU9]|nr:Rz-like spanin [Klebsiella phage Kpn BU9]